jgi:hypothetical protein
MNRTIELLGTNVCVGIQILDYTFKYETSTSATYGEGQDFYFHKFKTNHKKYGEDYFIVMTTTPTLTMRKVVNAFLDWATITKSHNFAVHLLKAGEEVMKVVLHRTPNYNDWADPYRESPLSGMVFGYAHNHVYVDCLADIELAWQDFNAKHGNIQLTTIYNK